MDRPPRQSLDPAGAGAVLGGTMVAGVAIGALLGWLVGSAALGALTGAIVGIPAGVFLVYRRYRGFFS